MNTNEITDHSLLKLSVINFIIIMYIHWVVIFSSSSSASVGQSLSEVYSQSWFTFTFRPDSHLYSDLIQISLHQSDSHPYLTWYRLVFYSDLNQKNVLQTLNRVRIHFLNQIILSGPYRVSLNKCWIRLWILIWYGTDRQSARFQVCILLAV